MRTAGLLTVSLCSASLGCADVLGFHSLQVAAAGSAADDGAADGAYLDGSGSGSEASPDSAGGAICSFYWTPNPSSACDTCAREQCPAQREACIGSEDCCNLITCLANTGNVDACQTEYPTGTNEYCEYQDCSAKCSACSGIVSQC
jgi:hypothetical protein